MSLPSHILNLAAELIARLAAADPDAEWECPAYWTGTQIRQFHFLLHQGSGQPQSCTVSPFTAPEAFVRNRVAEMIAEEGARAKAAEAATPRMGSTVHEFEAAVSAAAAEWFAKENPR